MSLSAGSRFGSYEILSVIGEGGMGRVYRARDTRLQRIVAVKVLPDSVAGDAERIARFEREAQTLAALNHPQGVCQSRDACRAEPIANSIPIMIPATDITWNMCA
jgi:serine/threonine protein kinase